MKYAVKFWGDISNPHSAPEEYPAIVAEIDDSVIEMSGYTIMTLEQLDARRAEFQDEYNAWAYIYCRPVVMENIRNNVDDKTAELIANGFMFQMDGMVFRVRCNDEDQRNYTGLIISKDFLPYEGSDRVKLKGYDANNNPVYANFANANEVVMLYAMGVSHVNNMLNDGWKIKDMGGTLSTGQVITTPIKDMNCQQLASWIDPRG